MSFELPSAASFAGFPSIRRSRGFRLYTPEGRRFLDLYQDAGRGMLGSRPKGLALRFKNSLDKLGPAAMPSIWEHRAARLLNSFFPDYPQVSVFPSYPEAMKALEARLGADSAPVRDPLDAGYGTDELSEIDEPCIWRPFLPVPPADVLLPVLPGTGTWGGVFVLSRKSLDLMPAPVPPFLLAPQVYAAGLFFRWISQADLDYYKSFPRGPWERRGPYLFPRCAKEDYPDLVQELISCGIYPSPDYHFPSIIPGSYEEGDIKLLRNSEGKWK